MENFANIFMSLLWSICGALNLAGAIENFISGHYLMGSFSVMVVLWSACRIAFYTIKKG